MALRIFNKITCKQIIQNGTVKFISVDSNNNRIPYSSSTQSCNQAPEFESYNPSKFQNTNKPNKDKHSRSFFKPNSDIYLVPIELSKDAEFLTKSRRQHLKSCARIGEYAHEKYVEYIRNSEKDWGKRESQLARLMREHEFTKEALRAKIDNLREAHTRNYTRSKTFLQPRNMHPFGDIEHSYRFETQNIIKHKGPKYSNNFERITEELSFNTLSKKLRSDANDRWHTSFSRSYCTSVDKSNSPLNSRLVVDTPTAVLKTDVIDKKIPSELPASKYENFLPVNNNKFEASAPISKASVKNLKIDAILKELKSLNVDLLFNTNNTSSNDNSSFRMSDLDNAINVLSKVKKNLAKKQADIVTNTKALNQTETDNAFPRQNVPWPSYADYIRCKEEASTDMNVLPVNPATITAARVSNTNNVSKRKYSTLTNPNWDLQEDWGMKSRNSRRIDELFFSPAISTTFKRSFSKKCPDSFVFVKTKCPTDPPICHVPEIAKPRQPPPSPRVCCDFDPKSTTERIDCPEPLPFVPRPCGKLLPLKKRQIVQQAAVCTEEFPCPQRADGKILVEPKKLPKLQLANCPAMKSEPQLKDCPPLKPIKLREISPPMICQPGEEALETCKRADDNYNFIPKALPCLLPAHCPNIDVVPMKKGCPLKRLKKKIDLVRHEICVSEHDCPPTVKIEVQKKKLPILKPMNCPQNVKPKIINAPPLKRICFADVCPPPPPFECYASNVEVEPKPERADEVCNYQEKRKKLKTLILCNPKIRMPHGFCYPKTNGNNVRNYSTFPFSSAASNNLLLEITTKPSYHQTLHPNLCRGLHKQAFESRIMRQETYESKQCKPRKKSKEFEKCCTPELVPLVFQRICDTSKKQYQPNKPCPCVDVSLPLSSPKLYRLKKRYDTNVDDPLRFEIPDCRIASMCVERADEGKPLYTKKILPTLGAGSCQCVAPKMEPPCRLKRLKKRFPCVDPPKECDEIENIQLTADHICGFEVKRKKLKPLLPCLPIKEQCRKNIKKFSAFGPCEISSRNFQTVASARNLSAVGRQTLQLSTKRNFRETVRKNLQAAAKLSYQSSGRPPCPNESARCRVPEAPQAQNIHSYRPGKSFDRQDVEATPPKQACQQIMNAGTYRPSPKPGRTIPSDPKQQTVAKQTPPVNPVKDNKHSLIMTPEDKFKDCRLIDPVCPKWEVCCEDKHRSSCKEKFSYKACTKVASPYPSFSELTSGEFDMKKCECENEYIKYLQPRHPVLIGYPELAPIQPRYALIDPKIEEDCIRKATDVENIGITGDCENYPPDYKPMRKRDYIETESNPCLVVTSIDKKPVLKRDCLKKHKEQLQQQKEKGLHCVESKEKSSLTDASSQPQSQNNPVKLDVPPSERVPASLSYSKPKSLWDRIKDYFKAKENCPGPDEWRRKLLRERAEKAAKAAGLEILDPKEEGSRLVELDCSCVCHQVKPQPEPECDGGGHRYCSDDIFTDHLCDEDRNLPAKICCPGEFMDSRLSKQDDNPKFPQLPSHCCPRPRFTPETEIPIKVHDYRKSPYPSFSECAPSFRKVPFSLPISRDRQCECTNSMTASKRIKEAIKQYCTMTNKKPKSEKNKKPEDEHNTSKICKIKPADCRDRVKKARKLHPSKKFNTRALLCAPSIPKCKPQGYPSCDEDLSCSLGRNLKCPEPGREDCVVTTYMYRECTPIENPCLSYSECAPPFKPVPYNECTEQDRKSVQSTRIKPTPKKPFDECNQSNKCLTLQKRKFSTSSVEYMCKKDGNDSLEDVINFRPLMKVNNHVISKDEMFYKLDDKHNTKNILENTIMFPQQSQQSISVMPFEYDFNFEKTIQENLQNFCCTSNILQILTFDEYEDIEGLDTSKSERNEINDMLDQINNRNREYSC